MHNKQMINIVQNFYNNNNFSLRRIAEIFNIPKSTIHRWICYNQIVKNSKNNTKKLKQNLSAQIYMKIIDNQIKINPFLSAKDIQNIIFLETKSKISVGSIYIYIHKLGFTFKKVPKRNYSDKNKLKLLQDLFKNKIKNIKFKDIICIDETCIYSNMINEYGWVKKDYDTLVYTKANPKKYTIIMAISCNKIIAYEILKNINVDQNLFHNFLKNKVFPLCNNKYVLMDNVRFHKTQNIIDLFDTLNNKILFIPPYSPQFNPIENVFGVIKNKYKKINDKNNCEKNIINIIENFDYDLWNFYDHAFNDTKTIINIFT
jgi:transposase